MSGKTSKVSKWVLWLSPLLVLVVVAKMFNQNPPVNTAKSSPDADAALKTRFYRAPWNQVVDAAQSAITAQKSYGRAWKSGANSIAGASPGAHLHETLRVQVPVIVFTDDLEVTISETDDGPIRVDCTSKSRIGRGDFGENQRHVVQFLRALDEKLAGKLVR